MYTILIVDDDPIVAQGISMGVIEPGRRLVVCHDLHTASIVVEREKVDAVVADIRFGGMFSYEGLELVDYVRSAQPECQVILMTGMSDEGLEEEGRRRGATGFLHKPFPISELDSILSRRERGSEESAIIQVPAFNQLFDEDLISVSYQPIVRLNSHEPCGFEALARIRTDSCLRNPELLFEYAARVGRLMELERHCLGKSITEGVPLTGSARLFLNVHPSSFERPQIVDVVSQALESSGLEADQIVLEITEQEELRSGTSLDQIDRLRQLGVQFALDDVGVAFSHLPFIDRIAPQWMKVSHTFGTGFENNSTKLRIVKNLADLARSFGANLILEGIETEATAEAARQCGIEFGQGYFFARPAPVANWCAGIPGHPGQMLNEAATLVM